MDHARPNILLIVSDQHRADCLGAYGNEDIRTPHLDRLAEDAVVYDNSFCAAPVCTPSRYSLLTGLYPHQHQGLTNHSTIPAGTDTFPRLLRQSGYRTKAVGKMHLTPTYLDVGFETMVLAEQNGRGRFEDDYHRALREKHRIDHTDLVDQVKEYRDQAPASYWDSFGSGESDLPEVDSSTSWIGERALDSIGAWGDEANLLMVSFIKPHHPFDPPAPWSRMYDSAALSLLPGWTEQCLPHDLDAHRGFFPHDSLTEAKLRQIMAYYYGAISQIDEQIGRMVALLKAKGMYERTMIVYTSDHGEYMGFHHMLLKNNHMYDPLAKVPLMIKYPHGEGAGSRSERLANNIDLAPTLLSQAGCAPGSYMPGVDLRDEQAPREFTFSEQGRGRAYMVRSQSYKLLLLQDEKRSLFYDLSSDPLEMDNRFHDPAYASIILEHKEALYRMLLFEAPAPAHVDRDAKCIQGDNIPETDDTAAMEAWVRHEMNKR